MIPFANVEEQSYDTLTDLRDALVSQDRQVFEAPLKKISLNEEGILHAGRFRGPLAQPALRGLLQTENAPADFVMHRRCPVDLSVNIVLRLAREKDISIVVQTVSGVATGIMPADRQPVRHEMLIDRLGVDRPIKEAVLTTDFLRITALNEASKELLPNDKFGFGWELINSENGWRSTEVSRWIVREICTNGLVGFDKTPLFRRTYNSREPVLASLQGLLQVIENEIQSPGLEPAIKWAADKRIGREDRHIVKYLTQRLGGETAKLELRDVTEDTSWYELMNTVTSLARLHGLEMRRRYEAEGGVLLNWFSRRGRGKPPWRRVSCDECEAWNVGVMDGQIN